MSFNFKRGRRGKIESGKEKREEKRREEKILVGESRELVLIVAIKEFIDILTA